MNHYSDQLVFLGLTLFVMCVAWNLSIRKAYILLFCYFVLGIVYASYHHSEASAESLQSLLPCEKKLASVQNRVISNSDIAQFKFACENSLILEKQKSILTK